MSKEHEDREVEIILEGRTELCSDELEDAIRKAYREGMSRAAQRVRYYLKHQNIGVNASGYETMIETTCENIVEVIEDEIEFLENST